jgi:uncharacterized protein YbaR (Trm112 family)
MSLAPELVEKLVCPKSKQRLYYFAEEARLVCPASRLAYRIERGIPVLLVDEAVALSDAEASKYAQRAKELNLPGA